MASRVEAGSPRGGDGPPGKGASGGLRTADAPRAAEALCAGEVPRAAEAPRAAEVRLGAEAPREATGTPSTLAGTQRRTATGRRSWGLRRYLVAGMLVWLPILATIWVVSFIVDVMDRTLVLLPERLQPEKLFGIYVPGLGALFAFVLVLLTGLAVTNLVGRQLVTYWEELLQRIPLVRSVYSGVKGFAESVLTSSHSFRQVVAVEYPRPGVWSIGFVTADDVPEVSAKTGEPLVCVFISPAPNPTAGFIILVPRSQLVPLEMSVDAAMKMIVTCGVVTPPYVGASASSALPGAE